MSVKREMAAGCAGLERLRDRLDLDHRGMRHARREIFFDLGIGRWAAY